MRKVVSVALLFLAASTIYGQPADQLYAQGYSAYTSYKWKDAMNLLWRYLNYKPQPSDLKDADFRNSVESCYNYARSTYQSQQTQQHTTTANDGPAASVAGLTAPPPKLRKPKIMVSANSRILGISGSWTLKIYHHDGKTYYCGLDLQQNGTSVSGTLSIVFGTDMPIVGTFENGVLTFACVSGQTTQSYTLNTINFTTFTGSYNYEGDSPDFGALTMARPSR